MNGRDTKRPERGVCVDGTGRRRRRAASKRAGQQSLPLRDPPSWGGKRKGAGRKPSGKKAGIPHRTRPPLASRFPVHVTMRVRPDVWNLRSRRAFDERLAPAIEKGKETEAGFRLVHYTVQGNHLHLVCEGKNADVLARGIQGLTIRMAKGLNRMMGRKGRVFADRYHARILRTPREVRNVLAYVFRNFSKHADEWMGKRSVGSGRQSGAGTGRGTGRGTGPRTGIGTGRGAGLETESGTVIGTGRSADGSGFIDPYSSARFFDGFRGPAELPRWGPRDPPSGAVPKTWLLERGWRRAGRIVAT